MNDRTQKHIFLLFKDWWLETRIQEDPGSIKDLGEYK